MIQSFYIKCDNCGKVTKINLSSGFLGNYPINIPCCSCKSSLCGQVNVDNRYVTINLINASVVEKCHHDYTLNFSGEFPSLKSDVILDDEEQLENKLSFSSKLKNVDKFYLSVKEMQETIDNWRSYNHIFKLNLNNCDYIFHKQDKEEFNFKCEDNLLRTVHSLEQNALTRPLYFNLCGEVIKSKDIYQLDFDQLTYMMNYLNTRYGYTVTMMDQDICYVYDKFVKLFSTLVPAFSLEFLNKRIDYTKYYTSTSEFSDISEYYLKVYNILAKLIVVPILLNNILYRFNYSFFNTVGFQKITIDEFIEMSNDENFKYCSNLESFTDNLRLDICEELITALKKGYYEYDKVSQIIKYRAHHKDFYKEITLLEVEKNLIDMVLDILIISEYIFRLRQVLLIDKQVRTGKVNRA